MEGGVGLAGAGRHDEENAVLASRNGFECAVDGVSLVVARHVDAWGAIVGRGDDLLTVGRVESLRRA